MSPTCGADTVGCGSMGGAALVTRRIQQVEIFEQAVDIAEVRPERGTSGLLEDAQNSRKASTGIQVMKQRFAQMLARARA